MQTVYLNRETPHTYEAQLIRNSLPTPHAKIKQVPLSQENEGSMTSLKMQPMQGRIMGGKENEPNEQTFQTQENEDGSPREEYSQDLDESVISYDGAGFDVNQLDKLHDYFSQRTLKFKSLESKNLRNSHKQPGQREIMNLMQQNSKLKEDKIKLINHYEEQVKRLQKANQQFEQQLSFKKAQSVNLDNKSQVKEQMAQKTMEMMYMEEINLMTNQVEDLEQEKKELEEENKQIKDDFEKQMLEYKNKIIKLQQDMLSFESADALEQKLKKSEQEKKALIDEITVLQKNRAELKDMVNKNVARNSTVNFEADEFKAKLVAVTAEKEYYQDELKIAKQQLQENDDKMKAKDLEIEKLKAFYEGKMQQQQQQLQQQQQISMQAKFQNAFGGASENHTPSTQASSAKSAFKFDREVVSVSTSGASNNVVNKHYENPFQDFKFNDKLLESFQSETVVSSNDNSFNNDSPVKFNKQEVTSFKK